MQKKYNLREWTDIGTVAVLTYFRDRQGRNRPISCHLLLSDLVRWRWAESPPSLNAPGVLFERISLKHAKSYTSYVS